LTSAGTSQTATAFQQSHRHEITNYRRRQQQQQQHDAEVVLACRIMRSKASAAGVRAGD
jgi:hypothetical protein